MLARHAPLRWPRPLLLFSAALRARCIVDPGDVVLTPDDLQRDRLIYVKPHDRVLLVSEWPDAKGRRTHARQGQARRVRAPPKVQRQDAIPALQADELKWPWLANTTFHSVSPAELVRSGLPRDDPATRRVFEDLFERAVAAPRYEAFVYAHDIRASLVDALQGVCCLDDRAVVEKLNPRMAAVLAVLAADPRRLAWAAEHLLQESALSGDEMVMEMGQREAVNLRLSVWSGFTKALGVKWDFGPHEHGYSTVLSLQLAGALEQHLLHRSGRLIDSFEFTPHLYREGFGDDGKTTWEAQANLHLAPMHGEVLSVDAGSSYFFPPRWIHAMRRPSGKATVSIELHVSLAGAACGSAQPLLVRTPDRKSPPAFQEWFDSHGAVLRQRVVTFLARGLQGDLDLTANLPTTVHRPRPDPAQRSPAMALADAEALGERAKVALPENAEDEQAQAATAATEQARQERERKEEARRQARLKRKAALYEEHRKRIAAYTANPDL